MAISTYKSFLMHKVAEKWEKLIDIKSFPDLGGTPELLETTTLSDPMTTNIMGIQSLDALEFEANYTKEDYTKLKALEGTTGSYAVWLGGTDANGTATPSGTDGKFEFDGQLSVYVNGGGVNEVVNMTVSIAASTPIKLGTDA
jgi:hypothetical protein